MQNRLYTSRKSLQRFRSYLSRTSGDVPYSSFRRNKAKPTSERSTKQFVWPSFSKQAAVDASGHHLVSNFQARDDTDLVGLDHVNGQTLRLLSFNIQAGMATSGYRDYLTHAWKQFLPRANLPHLDELGEVIQSYDIVSLQEVDGGSLRSGFVNQVSYLAQQGDFEHWFQQLNRNLGRFGQYSNGLLSRYAPCSVESHRLPGLRGRGAIVAKFGQADNPLVLVGLHLALSERAQWKQLQYVADLVSEYSNVVIMGDLNCQSHQLVDTPLRDLSLKHPSMPLNTFPSWRPKKNLDHILVSSNLKIVKVGVLPVALSDHLPVAMEIQIPSSN